ncbi:protein eva-1 homolog C-like isoform X2 [Grus americana]|uniref:protein eva-1 homolog C-like isoform X2 n=1 Tax=Grus americana TaxID=9117 RepID=UPI0024083528|nr:protein eva-1 homolog C-like isoform X2 [Grus americana]
MEITAHVYPDFYLTVSMRKQGARWKPCQALFLCSGERRREGRGCWFLHQHGDAKAPAPAHPPRSTFANTFLPPCGRCPCAKSVSAVQSSPLPWAADKERVYSRPPGSSALAGQKASHCPCTLPVPVPATAADRAGGGCLVGRSRAGSSRAMATLVGPAAALVLLCLAVGLEASPELSGYLRKVLRNHTAHTCDGEQLLIVCPRKTTISILGAFYGRRVPSPNLCPSPGNASQESTECTSTTAHLQRLGLELALQSRESGCCLFWSPARPGNAPWPQLRVPGPATQLYPWLGRGYTHRLQESGSCWLSARTSSGASSRCTAKSLGRTRALGHTSTSSLPTSAGQCHSPGNHRVKTVCENDKLRLQCRPKSILAIYSANYGRFLRGKPECDALNTGGPHIECLAPDALWRVSKKCHRKRNCTVAADQATFGDPCLPGMKKQLRVSYTLPKQLLEEVGPDTSDPFLLSDYMHGGWYKGPRFSRLREDQMIFTSSLAAFADLWGVPEKVGLYFLCGVSGGLMLLLCIISPKTTFLQEAGEALKDPEVGSSSELSRTKLRDEQDEDLPDDSSSDSSFRRLTHTYRATDSIFGPELTAAMEGAVEHQGRGGEEIWMPKESSPYAIHKIKSATK